MSHFHGYVHILYHHAPSVAVYSDASSVGFGGVYLHNWYVGAFDNDLSTELVNLTSHHWASSPDTLHINLQKMWAVLTASHHWAHLWRDLLVTIITDRSAINLGKSKNATIMAWIKEIFRISCFYNFQIHSVQIPSHSNTIADSLSQWSIPSRHRLGAHNASRLFCCTHLFDSNNY